MVNSHRLGKDFVPLRDLKAPQFQGGKKAGITIEYFSMIILVS